MCSCESTDIVTTWILCFFSRSILLQQTPPRLHEIHGYWCRDLYETINHVTYENAGLRLAGIKIRCKLIGIYTRLSHVIQFRAQLEQVATKNLNCSSLPFIVASRHKEKLFIGKLIRIIRCQCCWLERKARLWRRAHARKPIRAEQRQQFVNFLLRKNL